MYVSSRRRKDADIHGAEERRPLRGVVVLCWVGLQLISLGVEGAQEAGESRSLGGAPVFFPADDGHLVHPGQPCEFLLVQAALASETPNAPAEGAAGESREGQEQFERSSGRAWVVVNSG